MNRPFTLHVIVVPLVFLAVMQLGGCTRDTSVAPAPAGGVYRSASAGAAFEQSVQVTDKPGEYIAAFSLHQIFRAPDNPEVVYIAADSRGIVVSHDDGQTWEVIVTPLTRTFDVVALANKVLVASGVDGAGQGFVIRSLDGGKSWQSVLTVPLPKKEERGIEIIKPAPLPASVVLSIEPDPFNADRIYAGSSLGTLLAGEQSAKVWKNIQTITTGKLTGGQPGTEAVAKLIPSPHRQGEVLVITNSKQLLRIRDGQIEVIKIPSKLNEPASFVLGVGTPKQVLDAGYVAGFPDALLVGVEDGAVITRDGGLTWLQLPVPVEAAQVFNSAVVTISPTNANRLLVAINNVFYRSEDGGTTWNTFSLGLPNHIITGLSINPQNAAKVLAVTNLFQN